MRVCACWRSEAVLAPRPAPYWAQKGLQTCEAATLEERRSTPLGLAASEKMRIASAPARTTFAPPFITQEDSWRAQTVGGASAAVMAQGLLAGSQACFSRDRDHAAGRMQK